MSNITITNVDMGSVILSYAEFQDDVLNFAGEATVVEGTILGRLEANDKLVPFNPAGDNGSQNIVGVLTYDVSRGSAGDVPVRNMIAGTVRTERLIIDEDGDGSNIDKPILDALRSTGITPVSVTELNILDNQ